MNFNNQDKFLDELSNVKHIFQRLNSLFDWFKQNNLSLPDADVPYIYTCFGDIFQKQSEILLASEAYIAALKLDARYFWANRNLGIMLVDLGIYIQAIPYIENALKIDAGYLYRRDLINRLTLAHMYAEDYPQTTSISDLISYPIIEQTHGFSYIERNTCFATISILCSDADFIENLSIKELNPKYSFQILPHVGSMELRYLSDITGMRCSGYFLIFDEVHQELEINVRIGGHTRTTLLQFRNSTSTTNSSLNSTNLSTSIEICFRNYQHDHVIMDAIQAEIADIRLSPASCEYAYTSMMYSGMYAEAYSLLLSQYKKSLLNIDVAATCLDILCADSVRLRLSKKSNTVIKFLEEFKKIHGATVNYYLNLGHLLCESDDRLAAEMYVKAQESNSSQTLIDMSKGLSSIIDPENIVDSLPYEVVISKINRFGDVIHLFACDSKYFTKFASKLIESSVGKSDINITIHAHLVDPTPEAKELIEILVNKYDIDYSFGYSPAQIADKKSFYTTARFLVTEELLTVYNKPILITEADCLISWRWSQIMTWCMGIDYGLCKSGSWHFIPWAKIPAGVLWISPTSKGIEFISYISQYISKALWHSIGKSSYLWGVDQTAIWQSYKKHKTTSITKHIPMYSVLLLATGDKTNILI
jgi:tetratricopeptide (TPR) repeat protein